MNKNEVVKKLLNLYPDVINILGGDDVLNSESKIESIESYIKNHKWFVNQNLPFTVDMKEAFFSWHENAFLPQKNAMGRSNICSILNHLTRFEIFKMVSDEYYLLSHNDDIAYYNNACYSVINRESKSFFSRKMAKAKLAKAS